MMRDTGAAEGAAPQPLLITLSTGVVLRRTEGASWALTEVNRQMAPLRPKPPMIENPDRGRLEPNEADPDYQELLREHNTLVTERRYQVIIATGTAIEHVPDGVPEPDDPAWEETLAAVGLPCPPNMTKTERYLRWVKYIAAPTDNDWVRLLVGVQELVGTPEEDVAAATETFRGDAERGSD